MPEQKEAADENCIFIGKKPPMTYVLEVVTQFESQKQIHIKARGRAISKAVDVAELVRNKFVPDANIENILISTEELDTGNEKINVSTMEIILKK